MTEAEKQKSLYERLKKHPRLKERFEEILSIAEGEGNGPDTADAVEERAIIELHKLGQEVIEEWAEKKAAKELAAYREIHPQACMHKKK